MSCSLPTLMRTTMPDAQTGCLNQRQGSCEYPIVLIRRGITMMHTNQSNRTEREGYELFRRAIVERDDDAWAESAAHYRRLMLSWARDSSARMAVAESYEDLADHALGRAWMALSPTRFANFPSLGAVLAYLRTCVTAVVIDCARAEAARERMIGKLEVGDAASPEALVLGNLDRAELWRIVGGLIAGDQERVVVVESYLFALPPRTIL